MRRVLWPVDYYLQYDTLNGLPTPICRQNHDDDDVYVCMLLG